MSFLKIKYLDNRKLIKRETPSSVKQLANTNLLMSVNALIERMNL